MQNISIFNFLKKKISKTELQKFKKKIKNGSKNIHGIFNPIENLFNSNIEVINYTKQLLVERYVRFGFKKKEIVRILSYLQGNKKKLPDKNRRFINKKLLNLRCNDYYEGLPEKIIKRDNETGLLFPIL